MSNSASILTFGVELEFLLAYIQESKRPDPHPSNPRPIRFNTTEKDAISYRGRDKAALRERTISRHVAETLKAAGFPTNPECCDCGDIELWEVGFDSSLERPKHEHYSYHQMEVKTPALDFTAASLQSVWDAWQEGFTLNTVRKLCAFFYAFEPQLQTLHPQSRQGLSFCRSIRESCVINDDSYHSGSKGKLPATALEGVAHFLLSASLQQIQYKMGGTKFSAYNMMNLSSEDMGLGSPAGTIEFRQHAGSIRADVVIAWVRTVVGIVRFMRDIDEGPALTDFFSVCALEAWQRTGHQADVDNEAIYGPALCDKSFTVIDLFLRMGLKTSARYYHQRGVYKHLHPRIRLARPNAIHYPPELCTPYVGGVLFHPETGLAITVDPPPPQTSQSDLLHQISTAMARVESAGREGDGGDGQGDPCADG
ncbi:hypothetical protein B7494_g3775 [Chlorociboria aeruginascens]|nr:hypothetical protein B7494_g3775 [Chlorociboria aeruginascens]